MKIVIVDNPRPLTFEHYNDVANAPLSASLNSGYALAIARQCGWDTAHLDFTRCSDGPEAIAAAILAEDADIILLHWVYSWGHEHLARSVLELLKQGGNSQVGAFGLFPTLSRTKLFEYTPQLDFILAGEFEETLAELLRAFNPNALKPIPGLARPGTPFEPRPLISDISTLPIPDDVGANRGYPSLNIAASRGCYGECSFCFIKPYYGCNRRRVRTPASVERELETRLKRRQVDSLYFIDPTFIGQGQGERERAAAISRIAHATGLPFGFETRVDTIDEALIETLANNGATSVFLGIESGCDSVLRRINKQITSEQIARAVRILQGCALKLNIGFIMFEPDSSLNEIAENYAFLDGLGLLAEHDLTANLLYHNQIVLHGSPAWLRFEAERRLLVEERLPFEARYRFRDERVGRVCEAMGRLSSAYFKGIALPAGSRAETDNDAINGLLKHAFCTFSRFAEARPLESLSELEGEFTGQLRGLLCPVAGEFFTGAPEGERI